VKHLRGEEDPRHASLQDFREDEANDLTRLCLSESVQSGIAG